MATKQVNSTIRLRKDTQSNYNLIKDTFIPHSGEVCIVTGSNGRNRAKIGDGVSKFSELRFVDEDTAQELIVHAYYRNSKFYTDSTYTVECEKSEYKLYIEIGGNNNVYIYNMSDDKYHAIVESIPKASENIYGIVKLYGTKGINTDGAMTQKAVSDILDTKIEAQIYDEDPETLVLGVDLPILLN